MPSSPQPNAAETGRRIRRFAKILAVVLAIGFVLTFIAKTIHARHVKNDTNEAASASALVNTITVGRSAAALSLKLPGETAAWFQSVIYARVDGYVGKWNVDIGDSVTKGQVLATLETPDLDAQLSASQAKLKAAQAMVIAKKADADFARTTYDRWRDSPRGVVSEQEREAKKAAFESGIAQLHEAEAQVALDQADADRYRVLSQFKQVIAPYDGTITERHIDIGNLVTAGSGASTTPLYRITQNNPIRVFIDVPQSAAQDMKPGMGAHVSASNFPGRIFDGKVTRTSDALDPKARTLKVEVDITNAEGTLVPGMYVDVAFDIAAKGLLQVPAAALVFRSSGPEVAVVGKDGHIHFQRVGIARDNGDVLELSSGIMAGDTVALNISSQITDGEKVEARAHAR